MNAQILTWMIILTISIFMLIALWKFSKLLAIPIQIILFIILSILVFKTFFSKDNIDKLNEQVEKSGIVDITNDNVKKTFDGLDRTLKQTPRTENSRQNSNDDAVTAQINMDELFSEKPEVHVKAPEHTKHYPILPEKQKVEYATPAQITEHTEKAAPNEPEQKPEQPKQPVKKSKMFDKDMFKMETDSIFD